MAELDKNNTTFAVSIAASVLGGIGVVLIGTGIVMQIIRDNKESEKRDVEATTASVDKLWIAHLRRMHEIHEKAPKFAASLLFPFQVQSAGGPATETAKDTDWTSVVWVANEIFTAWEDHLTSEEMDRTDEHVWSANFLQFASSEILHDVWEAMKANYREDTQRYGDMLFFFSTKNEPSDNSELADMAIEFTETARKAGIYDIFKTH